jgi:hypothetical protein
LWELRSNPQHLVSVKPSTGFAIQREFGAAYFAVSEWITDRGDRGLDERLLPR